MLMKKASAPALITALLFSVLVGTLFVDLSTANPIMDQKPIYREIAIQAPQSNTYNLNTLLLNFTVKTNFNNCNCFFSLDEQATVKVEEIRFVNQTLISNDAPYGSYVEYVFEAETVLPVLSDGAHSLAVYYCAWPLGPIPANYEFLGSVQFSVDTTPPLVAILSLENKTYVVTEVPLDFTISEAVSNVSYCLDEQDNVTITGNASLPALSFGSHNIVVYATDLVGNTGASETITFTVAASFPLTSVAAASIASVTIVGFGLLVYFRKRRH